MRVARMMMIMTTIMMIMMALMSTMVMVMMFKVMVMITTTIMSMVVIFNNTGTWVDGVMVATITIRIHRGALGAAVPTSCETRRS